LPALVGRRCAGEIGQVANLGIRQPAAAILALPLNRLLSDAVGIAFIQQPLSFAFSVGGLLVWLVVVIVLGALASFLPARKASRLTIREVLAYE
jgi:putative ABC transport system permease protein